MEVLRLGHADCYDVTRAGAKAAHLSRLASRYRIPPGFCISAQAYSQWAELIDSTRPASPIPSILLAPADALASAHRDLGETCGVADPSVAVRSSAVDEDGATLSFAGQHETYLNIAGAHAVAEAVVRCWGWVRTERALVYRQQQGLSVAGAGLAVLVQQLVSAERSCLTMTTAPLTKNFPIPPEVEGFWACEKGHFPRPATPLTQELLYSALSEGFSAAMERWACPFGAQCRAINYYGFFTIKPFDLGAETKQERVARYQEQLSQVLPRMGELWEQTWLAATLPGLQKAPTPRTSRRWATTSCCTPWTRCGGIFSNAGPSMAGLTL